AGTGDECVFADSAGMEKESSGAKNFISAGQAKALRRVRYRIHRALSKIVRRRERFADNDLAALAQDNAVSKSSTDIDADDVFWIGKVHGYDFAGYPRVLFWR